MIFAIASTTRPVAATARNGNGRSSGKSGRDARDGGARHFRFCDNREKYLLFSTTTNEKAKVAEQIGHQLRHIRPKPPAITVFDAGMGDGTVLNRVLRRLHRRFPTVPWLVVGKEIGIEDVRLTLDKLPERFMEHPHMAVAITYMNNGEATGIRSRDPDSPATWIELALSGGSTEEFEIQISEVLPRIARLWKVRTSPRTGNPVPDQRTDVVIYRKDLALALDRIIPRPDDAGHDYDLIIDSQPYRARSTAMTKVRNVIAPLARALAPGGRQIVVQSYGRDAGMEVIHGIWPGENPFMTPRNMLLAASEQILAADGPEGLRYVEYPHDRAIFAYNLHTMADEVGTSIGTSTLLAAWNSAVYVAQIEDDRMTESLGTTRHLEVTRATLRRHGGLWFNDELFVIARDD